MENSKSPININITAIGVIKVILIFIVFYFLFLIREILAMLFVALIFASAVDPWVDWLQKRKVPRGISIIAIYLIALSVITGVVFLIIPPISKQVNDLANNFPSILEKVISGYEYLREYSVQHGILENIKENMGSISSNLQKAAGGIFSTVSGIIGSVLSFFLILVMTFYMVVEENALKKIVWSIAPEKYQVYVMKLINRMQKKVDLWLRGQLILSFIIFILTYVSLLILGVKYALVLALIAGLTEFVPYLGPILASIPAIFLAFTQEPILAVFVAILYYIIQLVENHIIVPKLMQKVVGLNPIISIAVLLVGFKVAGVLGAILSIPVATAISVFLRDIFENRVGKEAGALSDIKEI